MNNAITSNDMRYLYCSVLMETAKRSDLPDNMFGIPEERKYPLDTKEHVYSAVKLFNHVSPKYEEELATNIITKIKEYDITDIEPGKANRFSKYYKKPVSEMSLNEQIWGLGYDELSIEERARRRKLVAMDDGPIDPKHIDSNGNYIQNPKVPVTEAPKRDDDLDDIESQSNDYTDDIDTGDDTEDAGNDADIDTEDDANDYTDDVDDTEDAPADDEDPNMGEDEEDDADFADVDEPNDYTDDVDTDMDDTGDETGDDGASEDEYASEDEDYEESNDNNDIKNYNLLIEFQKLYKSLEGILAGLKTTSYKTSLQNSVLKRVIGNIDKLKYEVVNYIEFNFGKDYNVNLYYFNIYIQLLKITLEMANRMGDLCKENI